MHYNSLTRFYLRILSTGQHYAPELYCSVHYRNGACGWRNQRLPAILSSGSEARQGYHSVHGFQSTFQNQPDTVVQRNLFSNVLT
jgi:hypothetical protein